MKRTVLPVVCVCAAVVAVFQSCVYHDIPAYTCTETYSFSADVSPILQAKCAISGCHNGDLGPGRNWNDFEEFHKRVESGLVKYNVTHRIMPHPDSPNGPLSQEQINTIACWIDQGGLQN